MCLSKRAHGMSVSARAHGMSHFEKGALQGECSSLKELNDSSAFLKTCSL